MKSVLMLLFLFVAVVANLIGFFWTWNPRDAYETKMMVREYRCRECGFASSPGVIARDELCERAGPRCGYVQHEEKAGYAGALVALARNPHWWIFFGFVQIFLVAMSVTIYQASKRRRKPRSMLPSEPEDFDDPGQMADYLDKLRKFFHVT